MKHQFELAEWGDVHVFAYSDGIHNGPRCTACHLAFCANCHPERLQEECPAMAEHHLTAEQHRALARRARRWTRWGMCTIAVALLMAAAGIWFTDWRPAATGVLLLAPAGWLLFLAKAAHDPRYQRRAAARFAEQGKQ